MTTIKINAPAHLNGETLTQKANTLWNKLMAIEDAQAQNRTAWFLVSLVAQGVLFLPVPAVLIYYYNAPVIILLMTMALFFANVIAAMGGSGIRILISLFALSVLVHLIILSVFII
jgi:hypothetical protein